MPLIVRSGQHPDSASEQKAKAALEEASERPERDSRKNSPKTIFRIFRVATKASVIPANRPPAI